MNRLAQNRSKKLTKLTESKVDEDAKQIVEQFNTQVGSKFKNPQLQVDFSASCSNCVLNNLYKLRILQFDFQNFQTMLHLPKFTNSKFKPNIFFLFKQSNQDYIFRDPTILLNTLIEIYLSK